MNAPNKETPTHADNVVGATERDQTLPGKPSTFANDTHPNGCLNIVRDWQQYAVPRSLEAVAAWLREHPGPAVKPKDDDNACNLIWFATLADGCKGYGHPEDTERQDFSHTHGAFLDTDGAAATPEAFEASYNALARFGYGAIYSTSHNADGDSMQGHMQLLFDSPCPREHHQTVWRIIHDECFPLVGRSQSNPVRGRNAPKPGSYIEVIPGGLVDWRAVLERAPAPAPRTPRAEVRASATQRTEHDKTIVELFVSCWQRECQGHEAYFALGGWLLSLGVSQDRAEWIAEEISDKTRSTHPNPTKRIEQAYEDDCENQTGFPKLLDRLALNGAGLPGTPSDVRRNVHRVLDQVENLIRASVAVPPAPAPGNAAPDATHQPAPSTAPTTQERGCDPTVNEIITRLSTPSVGVYQRSGVLCTVTRDAREDAGMVRPAGAPTIRELAPARLREIIRTTCSVRDVSLAGEVMARGEWAYIRPLDAIVTYPIMRRDGTILLDNGYDAPTRTLAEIDVRVAVPDAPTQADAKAALETLADLVSDFPFVSESQRSAWLAMLLTVPARPGIDGPTPLGLLEASQRGSGKTLLADVISVIATGREAPRRVAPKTKEEWDKTMLSILLAGDPVVLLDNVTNMLVSDALDAVLTGTTYTQRLLGVSEERRVAIRTVFLASSNNARLSSDLVRRSIACRLEPDVEQPETRTGFRYADLLGYARSHRAALLGAALTVLRAYVVAGRPKVEARPMGSYSAWCRVVRDALIWAGGSDPAATQDALRESADVERDELRDLVSAWHGCIGEGAVTVRGALEAARDMAGGELATALLDALRGIMPNGAEPSAHVIGNRLRALRGQFVDGLTLREGKRDNRNTATWQVVRTG